MPAYKVPLRDIRFVMDDLLGFSEHCKQLNISTEIDDDIQLAIIEEAAKFFENVISPSNAISDQIGCTWRAYGVRTLPRFKEAYQQYCEGEWPSLRRPESFEGRGAVPYAQERLAMRALSGPKNPNGPADPIIVHSDVRRIFLTIKSFAEGFRAFTYYVAQQLDLSEHAKSQESKTQAKQLLALLAPICKGFMTELGCEAAHHGVQVLGGHGYIIEWRMGQNQRDRRISTLYEGATGIQALNLIGRKIFGFKGALLTNFSAIIFEHCQSQQHNQSMHDFTQPLNEATTQWIVAHCVGKSAAADPEEIGAASVDFLMFSGYTILAYLWARMAQVSLEKLQSGTDEKDLYLSKVNTARFYFQRILPRTATLKLTIQPDAKNLMQINSEQF
jgi:hypothetical protein